MPIDLLDRITTDARVRASRAASARAQGRIDARGEWHLPTPSPGSYGDMLMQQADTPCQDRIPPNAPGSAGETTLSQRSLPRTLLLITTDTMCMSCGARYRAPSATVFAVYAANSRSVLRDPEDIRKLERWCAQYNHKPLHEHQVVTVYSPACEACF